MNATDPDSEQNTVDTKANEAAVFAAQQEAKATPEVEYEYVKMEVTRTSSTDIYFKVFKGENIVSLSRNKPIIAKCIEETTSEMDWDEYNWEKYVEVESARVCKESTALRYKVYDTTKADK